MLGGGIFRPASEEMLAECRPQWCEQILRRYDLLSSVSRTAPIDRGLLQVEFLRQDIDPRKHFSGSGAVQKTPTATLRVAVARPRDPFAGLEHSFAGTDCF